MWEAQLRAWAIPFKKSRTSGRYLGTSQPLHLWGQNQCWARSDPQVAQQQFKQRPVGCLPFVCNLFLSPRNLHVYVDRSLKLFLCDFFYQFSLHFCIHRIKVPQHLLFVFHGLIHFFSLTLLIYLEFNLVAGQGWGPRIHVTQLNNLNSSLLPTQGLWKGEGASASHEVVCTS